MTSDQIATLIYVIFLALSILVPSVWFVLSKRAMDKRHAQRDQQLRQELDEILEFIEKKRAEILQGASTSTMPTDHLATLELVSKALDTERKACDNWRKESLDLRKEIAKAERWEIGFRNIVTILHGARHPFEIEDIVEEVRSLKQPPSQG